MSPLTSQPWTHSSAGRSEAATLRRGVALMSTMLSALVVGGIATAMFISGDTPATPSRLLLIAAVALAILGLILRQRRGGPWMSLAALIVLLVIGLGMPAPPVELLVVGTYSVMFLAILLSSRDWGIGWIVVGTILLLTVESHSTLVVTINEQSVNVGFVAVLQGIVAGGWLWWAWHAALGEAERRDLVAASQEEAIAVSLSIQERTRIWRSAITRTHETILNDLRYVLRSPEVDRERLREQLHSTREALDRPPAPPHTLAAAIDRASKEFPGEVSLTGLEELGGVVLPSDLDSVLLEVVRNIARHTRASRILIAVRHDPAGLAIEIVDDGDGPANVPDHGDSAEAIPGIGRSVVLGDALVAAGARLETSAHRCVITISTGRTRNPPAGRTLQWLLSVVLVGSALGGSLQFLLLLSGGPRAYVLVTAAAYALTALATVVVIRRRRIGWLASSAGAVLVLTVALGLSLGAAPCAAHPLSVTTLNLSLDAFFGMLLWVRSRVMWLVTLPVFAAVLAALLIPQVCSAPVADVLLSSAILMPILIIVSWTSTLRAERWEAEDRRRWETDISQGALAEAESDLAHHLEGSIELAWSLMSEVADGADLDESRRRRLRSLESSIRAAIQTDPRTAGGFSRAAQHIVTTAVFADVPVHVRALRSSADPRPLDHRVLEALAGVASADADRPASIHVFYDGLDDYLSLTTTESLARTWGFAPESIQTFGDAILETEFTDSAEGDDPDVTLLLRRSAVAPDAPFLAEPLPEALVIGSG